MKDETTTETAKDETTTETAKKRGIVKNEEEDFEIPAFLRKQKF